MSFLNNVNYKEYALELKLVAMAILSLVISILVLVFQPEPSGVVHGQIKVPVSQDEAVAKYQKDKQDRLYSEDSEHLDIANLSGFVKTATKAVVKNFRKPPEKTAAVVSYAVSVAKQKKLDPRLVLSVIAKESSFNPKVVGVNGEDYGLMQVNIRAHADKVAKVGGEHMLFNYKVNINIGTDILKSCISRFKTRYMQLRCYNGLGPTSVDYPDGVMRFYPLFS